MLAKQREYDLQAIYGERRMSLNSCNTDRTTASYKTGQYVAATAITSRSTNEPPIVIKTEPPELEDENTASYMQQLCNS
jgi:hypothetical protein